MLALFAVMWLAFVWLLQVTMAGETAEAAGAAKTQSSEKALAFKAEVLHTGTIEAIHFLCSSGTATGLKMGVYANNAGVPGTLKEESVGTSGAAGKTELSVTGLKIKVTAGETVYIAILPLGGSASWKPGSTTATIFKGNTAASTLAAAEGHFAAATTEGPIGLWATGTEEASGAETSLVMII